MEFISTEDMKNFTELGYTFTSKYTPCKIGRTYHVIVTDKDGNDITKYTFNEDLFGIPESDSKVHYVFKGWDTDLSNGVTKDTVVRPAYEAVAHTFDDGVASAATCTQPGGYKYTCS